MIEVKTAELIGPALDWAVGIATGGEQKPYQFADNIDAPFWEAWVFPDGYACSRWSPSTDWSQGGPLIDKHNVEILRAGDCVMAKLYGLTNAAGDGKTPLIAACRAIVTANQGDVVSVPEELVQHRAKES